MCIALLGVLAASSSASAQAVCARRSSCSIGSSTSSALTIVGIGSTTLTQLKRRQRSSVDRFLRNNRVAFLSATALGAGAVLEDLAEFHGVSGERRAPFFDELIRRREELARGFEEYDDSGYLRAVSIVAAIAASTRESESEESDG